MIKNIYGDYIWISSLDKEFVEEYKKEFFSKMQGTNKETITTDSWRDCNVKSSFFNEPFINNCSSIDFNMMFSKKVSEEINLFFIKLNEDQGTLINIPVYISKIWYNEYNYNDFQESHCHSGRDSFYSFVYILKSKDINIDSKLVFENPRSSHLQSIIIGDRMNSIDNYKQEYIPNLSEGDLIVFPSHMKHNVKFHKNKNDSRISISGNICMSCI
tara:strand:- start:1216 stop:1860 length:645 start_codon:yes stop_codon:yes gene_type:complete